MGLLWLLVLIYVTFAQFYPPPYFGHPYGGFNPYHYRPYNHLNFHYVDYYNPYNHYGTNFYNPYTHYRNRGRNFNSSPRRRNNVGCDECSVEVVDLHDRSRPKRYDSFFEKQYP
ncbi:hypothetical protein DICVIV_11525 [Dictyocaulus viviparus]|uniref:Uncharacterized protein n=1 Tax=Dictyocaulus viviparus TaxID=29172 RepID=A0A0D8XCY6_DICVI|nr:hypothetical protein DICVIV_11525 [Dictyocaulus viviparus]